MSIVNKIKVSFILITVIMLASCTNSIDIPANEGTDITYGFSARLHIDSNISEASSVVSRTAMPSIPATAVYYIDYVLDAEKDDASKHIIKTNSDTGVFITSNGKINGFYIPLSAGKWVIEAGIKDNNTTILKDSKTITLTPENPLMTNQVFFLKMSQTIGSGKGSIKLKVTAVSGTEVSSIKVVLEDGREITKNSEDFFEASDIPSGQQKILINAYNSSSQLIYSTIQYINIYDNITTNQWILDGTEKATYEITKIMIEDFRPRQYYVDGRAESDGGKGDDDENTGTSSESPFKTIAHTIAVINARPETYAFTIHVRDGSYELDDNHLEIQKSVTIECWKNKPNDRLGSAKVVVRGGTECVLVGPRADDKPVNFYLESLANDNTSGLEINGNGSDRCGVKIQKGIFVLNGGRIRQTGDTSSTYDGVILPDDSNAQFIMLKGNISDNRGSVACGVYIGTGTIFQMEGGEIIDNKVLSEDGYAVKDLGEMYIKGLINISNNFLYDGNSKVFITDSENNQIPVNKNLYLPVQGTPKALKRLKVLGPLFSNGSISSIGISAPIGSGENEVIPTAQKPVVITKNYKDAIAPSVIFQQDKSSPYVFMKSTDVDTYGEASFGLGGGVFYLPTDYSFTFTSDVTSVTRNTNKIVTITPNVTRKESETVTTQLHYNPEDCKLYLTYSDSTYSNPAAGDEELSWHAELSLAGVKLPDAYQPSVATNANKFTIPGLPYKETYTLTITVTFMDLEYSASFPIVCN